MIRLLRAETNRLLSRRLTAVVVLAVLAIVGLSQIGVNAAVSPPTAAQVAENKRYYDDAVAEWEANHEEIEAHCVAEGGPPEHCVYPRPAEADFGLVAAPFAEVGEVSVMVGISVTALAAFLLAGSLIGAEYGSGALANWLSFRPERGRVFAAKLIVVTGAAAVLGTVVLALALGLPVLLTVTHGGALDQLGAVAQQAALGVVPVTILAVVGFCVTLLARHTAAGLGVLVGYLLVWFARTVILGGQPWAARLTPWSPDGNLAAIVNGGYDYAVPVRRVTAEGVSLDLVSERIGLAQGLGYWLVLLTGLIAVAVLVFRRRDVN